MACTRDRSCAYRILVGIPEGKGPLGRPRHRWGIILKLILKKWGGEVWTRLVWLRVGSGGGRL